MAYNRSVFKARYWYKRLQIGLLTANENNIYTLPYFTFIQHWYTLYFSIHQHCFPLIPKTQSYTENVINISKSTTYFSKMECLEIVISAFRTKMVLYRLQVNKITYASRCINTHNLSVGKISRDETLKNVHRKIKYRRV